MNAVDQLLTAQTELVFFLILSGSLHGDLLRAHDNLHGYGIKLSIEQNLQFMRGGRRVITRKITHEFTLYQDNTLIWERLGHAPISGLAPIQQAFQEWRDAFQRPALIDQDPAG
jgi:hypothetical protein